MHSSGPGQRLVVVGGGAAGSRALRALVAGGYPGELHLIAAEPDGPYYRPALSKQLLAGTQELPQLRRSLVIDPAVTRHDSPAVGVDLAAGVVRLSDDTSVGFDRLLVASGSVRRVFPGLALGGRIGSIDDPARVAQVRTWLAESPGPRTVLVVGGGLIGSEVASTLHASGAEVIVVDPSLAPLARALGSYADELCRSWHAEAGIRVHLGQGVTRLDDEGSSVTAVLADGTQLRAHFAVVAVGVRPSTDWLVGSGLPLTDQGALQVDSTLLVPGHEQVAAAGDVADWPSSRAGRRRRVEHWAMALEQGAVAAHNLTHDDPRPFDSVPVFWTEQSGRMVHVVGECDQDSVWTDVTEQALPRGGRVVAALSGGGAQTGYLLIQAPQLLRRYQQQLAGQRTAGLPR
jgi:3-phenylpropionate/trans-cinnamate dioxygenase ferredoxin reductase subunit